MEFIVFKLIKIIFSTVFCLTFICIMIGIHILILLFGWFCQVIALFFALFVFLVSSVLPERLGDRFVAFCDFISSPFIKIFEKCFGTGFGTRGITRTFHLDSNDYN